MAVDPSGVSEGVSKDMHKLALAMTLTAQVSVRVFVIDEGISVGEQNDSHRLSE